MTPDYQILLRTIFKYKNPDEYIEVSIHKDGSTQPPLIPGGKQFFLTVEEASNFISNYADKPLNCWYGVLPRKEKSGKVEAVSRWTCVWAEIDVEPEEAYKLIRSFLLPPTAIVKSGHGLHSYWLLDGNVDETVVEIVMKQIAVFFDTDPVYNPNRLLRLPGTWNSKDINNLKPCSLVEIDEHSVYSLQDVVGVLQLNKSARKIMLSESKGRYKSRSERDMAALRYLANAGISRQTIERIWLNAPFGNKAREEPPHYREFTLNKIFAEQQLNNLGLVKAFQLRPEGMYVGGSRISTFTIEPTMIVENPNEEDVIIGDVTAQGRTWSNVAFPRSAFTEIANFQKHLHSLAWQWFGSKKQLLMLLPFLYQRAQELKCPQVIGIRQTGYHNGYFISANQIISEEGLIKQDESEFVLLNPEISEYVNTSWNPSDPDPYLFDRLMEYLPNINKPNIILPVLGWFCATPFKQVLSTMDVRFPILNVHGEQGSGKTTTITKVFYRLFCLSVEDSELKASTTTFSLLKRMSSTNAFPIFFDEYRSTSRVAEKFMEYLRTSYDTGKDARGRPDQTLVEYTLSAPVIVGGIDGLDDDSGGIVERIIQVRFLKHVLNPGSTYRYTFEQLTKLPLGQFGYWYYKFALDAINSGIIPGVYEESYLTAKRLFDGAIPGRMLDNIATTIFGLKMLQRFLSQYKVEFHVNDELVKSAFSTFVHEVIGDRGRVELTIDELITDVLNEYAAYLRGDRDRMYFSTKYYPEKNEFWFHLDSAIKWFLAKRRRENLGSISIKALKNQLSEREGEYYVGANNQNLDGTIQRLHAVNIDKCVKMGLPVPERFAVSMKQSIYFVNPKELLN